MTHPFPLSLMSEQWHCKFVSCRLHRLPLLMLLVMLCEMDKLRTLLHGFCQKLYAFLRRTFEHTSDHL